MSTVSDYIKEQQARGFEVGDKVRILRAAETGQGGWRGMWAAEMRATIGCVGEVQGTAYQGGTHVAFENGLAWHYPHFVLEKVEEASTEMLPVKDPAKVFQTGDPVWFEFLESGDPTEELNRIYRGVVSARECATPIGAVGSKVCSSDPTAPIGVSCEELLGGASRWYKTDRVRYYTNDPRKVSNASGGFYKLQATDLTKVKPGQAIWISTEGSGVGVPPTMEPHRKYQGKVLAVEVSDDTFPILLEAPELLAGARFWPSRSVIDFYQREDLADAMVIKDKEAAKVPTKKPKASRNIYRAVEGAVPCRQQYTYVELLLEDGRIMKTPMPEGEGWKEVARGDFPEKYQTELTGWFHARCDLEYVERSSSPPRTKILEAVHPAFIKELRSLEYMYIAVRRFIRFERPHSPCAAASEEMYDYHCPSKKPLQGNWPNRGGRIAGPLKPQKGNQ